VSYRAIQLRMAQWRQLVQQLVDRCTQRFHDELLFGLHGEQPFPRAHQLHDDFFNHCLGQSFLDCARNAECLAPWRNWLLRHVGTHPATQRLTRAASTAAAGDDEPSWDEYGIRAYLKQVRAFKRELMVLIHVTARLPARATELLSARWCNSELLRNIFISEGYVMLLIAYHKLEWRVGARAIARFLPPVVGDLVVQFLLLVQPFVRILQSVLPAATAATTTTATTLTSSHHSSSTPITRLLADPTASNSNAN
jgi:hypothetical protein